jgi:hypothetical protein
MRESRVSFDIEPGIPMPGSTDVLSTDNVTTFFDFTAAEERRCTDAHVYKGRILSIHIFKTATTLILVNSLRWYIGHTMSDENDVVQMQGTYTYKGINGQDNASLFFFKK